MGFRRLRGRLDALQADAHDTMEFAREVLEDFKDGFYIELELKGKTLPLRIRLIADEEVAESGPNSNDPTIDILISKVMDLLGK